MNLIGIRITSNAAQVAKAFDKEITGFLNAHSNFLDSRKDKVQQLAYLTTKRIVYGVPFKPSVYVRTMRLLNSIYTEKTLSNKSLSNFHEALIIDSRAEDVPALAADGGYAKFVAGEGNGITTSGFKIGFLRTIYNKKPSYFPRPFHEYIFVNVKNYLYSEYDKNVLAKLK
jgi:hypothetical protein